VRSIQFGFASGESVKVEKEERRKKKEKRNLTYGLNLALMGAVTV